MSSTERKPIKRSKELTPLSREHHDGLLLCWKIRTGLKKKIAPERIAAYIQYFFEQNLLEHFKQEEAFVFSLLPEKNNMKMKALQQHASLKKLIGDINYKPTETFLLDEFADKLDEHIRYEERTLFPYIEQHAADKLAGIAAQSGTAEKAEGWEDEFWR